jgi:hypothetical protein
VNGMDGRLGLSILASFSVFVIAAGIAATNPAGPSDSGLIALIILSVSALLFMVIQLILFARRRKRHKQALPLEIESGGDRSGFFHRRSAILFIVFLVGRVALGALVNSRLSISSLLIISLHVLLTGSLGILYSRWAYSEEYVPILAALIVIVADSALYAFNYASDPSRQFRYGPEIFWFAASGISGRLMLIPIISVIIWGSWKLSSPRRAIDITDPPVLIGLS